MNEPLWEDQLHDLHRLADQVSAPASVEARQAIHRRAGVLRRRRQVRRTVAASALVVLLVAGILVLQGRGRADLETGPANPAGEGSLPALTLDLDGWRVVDVSDTPDQTWDSAGGAIEPGMTGSLQVFRRPGQLDGPAIVLEHTAASDPVMAQEGEETVSIDGYEGYLRQVNPTSITLNWAPSNGDGHARLRAFHLTQEEVVEFANGLRPKDGDAGGIPGDPDDVFGFEATELPGGIEEDPVGRVREPADFRQVVLERGSSRVEIRIDTRGDIVFENNLADRLMNDPSADQITVLDRPAVLFGPTNDSWSLVWRQGEAATVEVFGQGEGVDRAAVDEIVDGLRELSDEEWQDLAAPFE